MERRQFLVNSMNAGILGMASSMTVAGYYEARRLAQIREITIPIAGLPDDLLGFHLVQLSDIHVGPTIKKDYLQGIVERSNELNTDMVAITGDLVDGTAMPGYWGPPSRLGVPSEITSIRLARA